MEKSTTAYTAIVLAAGKGTRMNSKIQKHLFSPQHRKSLSFWKLRENRFFIIRLNVFRKARLSAI